jgi:hypothetical protein
MRSERNKLRSGSQWINLTTADDRWLPFNRHTRTSRCNRTASSVRLIHSLSQEIAEIADMNCSTPWSRFTAVCIVMAGTCLILTGCQPQDASGPSVPTPDPPGAATSEITATPAVSEDGLTAESAAVATLEKLVGNASQGKDPLRRSNAGDVVAVDLTSIPATDADLQCLKDLSKLKDVKVRGQQITNAGVAHFAGMTNLRVLSLQDTQVDDAGLEQLKGLTNLEDLTLFKARVTAKGLASLSGLTKLKRLNLRATGIDGTGLRHLKTLQNLKVLDLSETAVSNEGLEELAGLTQLEDLNLWATRVGDAGMPSLCQITSIKRLNLDNVGYPDKDIALTDKGVREMARLANLEWTHLGKTKIGDAGLEAFQGLAKLKELIVTHCPDVTDAGAAKLGQARPDLKISR